MDINFIDFIYFFYFARSYRGSYFSLSKNISRVSKVVVVRKFCKETLMR